MAGGARVRVCGARRAVEGCDVRDVRAAGWSGGGGSGGRGGDGDGGGRRWG